MSFGYRKGHGRIKKAEPSNSAEVKDLDISGPTIKKTGAIKGKLYV